ncbi:MAG: hypothetical protein AAF802_02595 [Planctomycetota bacterium]
MTEEELLVDCLRRLEGSGIDYMLVGSMAGNYWGVPRSTHDIDFVIEYGADQVSDIVAAFEEDFFIQQVSVESGLRPPHQFNALDNRSALKVDFFRVAGDEYEFERFRRKRRVTLFDQLAWIAASEDVLLHKLRWHLMSPTDRQLSDARGIFLVSGDVLDRDYLDYWAKQIGVDDLLSGILGG